MTARELKALIKLKTYTAVCPKTAYAKQPYIKLAIRGLAKAFRPTGVRAKKAVCFKITAKGATQLRGILAHH